MGSDDRLLAPQQCVLGVIDRQRWYLDPAVTPFGPVPHDRARRIAAQDRLIAAARSAGVPVAWTTMTEGDHDAPPNTAHRWRGRVEEPRLRHGDEAFAFAGTPPRPEDVVAHKTYPDAFSSPGFADHLGDLGRTTLVLIGGFAGRCILATAFAAQARDLDVVVPDGLAIPHPAHPEEAAVVEAVIRGVVGHWVNPQQLHRAWGARARPADPAGASATRQPPA